MSSHTYTPLEDKSESGSQPSEDSERLLGSDSETVYRKPSRKIPVWVLIVLIPLISLSLIAFGAWIGSRWFTNINEVCLAHVQHYSPILKEVDNSYHTVHFEGSFLHENIYRQTGSPEVDAAWEALGINYRGIAVPVDEAPKSGIKPDQVQINPKYGGGFPANVEGLHHLHCLNLVRQGLYYNIDYYRAKGQGAFINNGTVVKYHISHCLDIIRQQLMCTPDTGLLGQVWWDKAAPKAFVDFNTEHKCKNYDAIKEWARVRQLPAGVPDDFLKPPRIGDTVYDAIP
ncbi:protein of unknown function (DUF3328) domain containing protein [Hyaloscypha variabilis]|jgi:hypothetical protein|uniref:Tat pathway signal sequence n=1 Tax=Hyaloscypha variabilis (strain UAMH 11265 / GT02V1 / F) TaxID=1149755 RepID=A0A2J6RYL1_HYAVF|nr:hypothetical protein L207DRAFT_455753 [Hyaloscypha variabilis F]